MLRVAKIAEPLRKCAKRLTGGSSHLNHIPMQLAFGVLDEAWVNDMEVAVS